MNVKKIIEILEMQPQFANDPAGFLVYLNMKSQKQPRQISRVVGVIKIPSSIADANGGEATIEDVEAAIAYKEKKDKNK